MRVADIKGKKMAINESNRKIVRTGDGIQYEIESDEPYSVRRGQIGEYIDARQPISEFIQEVAGKFDHSFRRTRTRRASVTFGVGLSPYGAFFLTQGTSDAHVVVTLEFDDNAPGGQ